MGEPINILIVEDSKTQSVYIASIFKTDNYSVQIISDGKEAYDFLCKDDCSINIVITDYQLPGMNGIEIIRNVKATGKNYGYIFLTVDNTITTVLSAMKAGAHDFIHKGSDLWTELPLMVAKVYKIYTDNNTRLKQEEQLIMLNATKDKFFSIIAHDLRNPFNSISLITEMLIEDIKNKNTDNLDFYAESIQSTSTNAYNLLENLLDWAKSQTGTLQNKPEILNFQEVLKQEIENLKILATSKNIKINFNEIDLNINVDRNMLRTIIYNLLTNAIKFSTRDSIVNIEYTTADDFTQISITDYGVGMNAETINKLFRIDINPSSIGTGEEKGSGLGLILCKEFVDKIGGKIWVESEVGKGSTFFFTIPQ